MRMIRQDSRRESPTAARFVHFADQFPQERNRVFRQIVASQHGATPLRDRRSVPSASLRAGSELLSCAAGKDSRRLF